MLDCCCVYHISVCSDQWLLNLFVMLTKTTYSLLTQWHNRCWFLCLLFPFPPPPLLSEIRLVEILENLCDSSSFDCNHMVEEHEDHFETWWFKRWVLDLSAQLEQEGSTCPISAKTLTYLGLLLLLEHRPLISDFMTPYHYICPCGISELPGYKSIVYCDLTSRSSNPGKISILICISGSALIPSMCAVWREHLALIAMVKIYSSKTTFIWLIPTSHGWMRIICFLLTACVAGSERPCHGNGVCDGDGTRGGNGRCNCDHGYNGEFCLDCIDGYFNEIRNDTFSLCTGTWFIMFACYFLTMIYTSIPFRSKHCA